MLKRCLHLDFNCRFSIEPVYQSSKAKTDAETVTDTVLFVVYFIASRYLCYVTTSASLGLGLRGHRGAESAEIETQKASREERYPRDVSPPHPTRESGTAL